MKKILKASIYLTLTLIAFCSFKAMTHPSKSEVKEKAQLVLNYKFQEPVDVIKKSGIFWGGFQSDSSVNGTMVLSDRDFEQVEKILRGQLLNAKVRALEDMTLPKKLEYQRCADPKKELCVEIWHPFNKADETFTWSLNSSDKTLTFEWQSW